MSYLASADIQYFTRRLVARRDALRKILRATVITSLRTERPSLGNDVHDVGDESFAELMLGVDVAAHMREIQELQDIDAALKRVATPEFGYCVNCSGEIGFKRLTAFLTAKRCLVCQQQHERSRSGGSDLSPSL